MTDRSVLRDDLWTFLMLEPTPSSVEIELISSTQLDGYTSQRVNLRTESSLIPAILARPQGAGPFPGVLALHQHAGQRHFGKSEVFGLVGDPYQAFGPSLAKAGIVVLAPDSVAFEDRGPGEHGTDVRHDDFEQHYNEMTQRIVNGRHLMQTVLSDAVAGISALRDLPETAEDAIGALGHSYGGNTTLFLMAVDERVRFGCASGALGSYQHKIANGIGIEMAQVIPGFAEQFDINDVVHAIAPRPLLAVSGTNDRYAADANSLAEQAMVSYKDADSRESFAHLQVQGGHALEANRFDHICDWMISTANGNL